MIFYLSAILFFTVNVAYATKPVLSKDDSPTTKEIMNNLATHLTALKKFMVSQEKFTDPKNNFEIANHLKQMSKNISGAHTSMTLQKPNFKISREVLEEHLEDTERLFRMGNKNFARWKFASTVSVCMSCHMQMPTVSKTFTEFRSDKMFTSRMDQAEFLFAIRDFEAAYKIYDSVILNYNPQKNSPGDLDLAFGRQLIYFSRIKRDPVGGIAVLEKYAKNKAFSQSVQEQLKSWIKQFEQWKKSKIQSVSKMSGEQIITLAKKNLNEPWIEKGLSPEDDKFVTYLLVSGLLYEYLQLKPESNETPEVLYWLSICDRAIQTNFFYSLADLYLRECVLKYPSNPIAKKCFKELETETILGFTGSRGTDVPPEVELDLLKLRKLIDENNPSKLEKQ